MRTKLCRQCREPFQAEKTEAILCPACSAAYFRAASINDRTCRQCGAVFRGGPRAWYCPGCRLQRRREADKRHKRNGTSRPIGSTDKCIRCGLDYVVNSLRQVYCKLCSDIAVPEKVRQQTLQYKNAHKDALLRNKSESHRNRNICIICGAVYDTSTPTVTCSPACAAKLKKLRQDEADIRRGRRKMPAGIYFDSGKPKSGVVGVTASSSGKWRAAYKGKYIGTFATVPEAAAAIEKYKEENKNDQ